MLEKLLMLASLSYGNNENQKGTKRKQNQNKNASYYIFTTRGQPERCTSGIDDMDNRLTSILLLLSKEATYCRLFIWVGTSSQIFGARWDSVTELLRL